MLGDKNIFQSRLGGIDAEDSVIGVLYLVK
ncbi:MAG: hypothetical protein ACJATI_004617 [Halioglobus sp.]